MKSQKFLALKMKTISLYEQNSKTFLGLPATQNSLVGPQMAQVDTNKDKIKK